MLPPLPLLLFVPPTSKDKLSRIFKEAILECKNLTNLLKPENNKCNKKIEKECVYYKITEDTKEKFVQQMEQELRNRQSIDMENFEHLIINSADNNMKVRKKTKIIPKNEKKQSWINDEIIKSIKSRKMLNKVLRKSTPETRDEAREKYLKQKIKTKGLIQKAIREQEKKVTNEIRNDKSKKKLWTEINKLQGKDVKKKETKLYREDGSIIEEEQQIIQEMEEYWKNIYQKHENNSCQVWNEDQKQKYKQYLENTSVKGPYIIEETGQKIPHCLREHIDSAVKINEDTSINETMQKPEITVKELENALTNIKNNKAPGPDGIKGELLKALANNETCKLTLLKCYNDILNGSAKIPSGWKESNTNMIPKVRKPTVKDLRPIALLNATYKLFMAILKNKIESHIENTSEMDNLQAGFTKERRIEDNLFILNYCVNYSYRYNKQLIVTAIDFSKAFDSIDRKSLIGALKKFKVHTNVINNIFNIYDNDSTTLNLNGQNITNMKITSGIRQGCTGSTTLFKLVTFIIIKAIKNYNHGFRNRKYFIPALFFADDGLIMSETKTEAEKMISKLNNIASECGLEVNKLKSHVLVFNKKENFDKIANIETVESLKYLGVTISNQNDCFTLHKENLINKAQKVANLMPAVISRSSNRLLVGKTFWKGVALPKLLFSTTVIPMKANYIQKLQAIENSALRKIFFAPKFTPIGSLRLRGEIGISQMKIRLHKNILNFTKHLLTSKNILVQNICKTELEKNYSPWAKQVNKILFEYNLDTNILLKLNKNNIKEGLKKIDNETWKNSIKEKTSLKLYNEFKLEMKEETMYKNEIEVNNACKYNTK